MKNIKKYFLWNIVWAAIGTLLLSLLGISVNAILARLLSTADLGIYFLLISFATMPASIAQAGVLQVLLRKVALAPEVGGKKDAAKDLRSACLLLGIGLVIVCTLILLLFDFWIATLAPNISQLDGLALLFAAWVFVIAYQGVVTESYRGLHDIRHAIFFSGLLTNSLLITLLATWWASGHKPMLVDIIAAIVGISFLSLLLGVFILSRRLVDMGNGTARGRLRSLYRESRPLMTSSLLAITLTNGDLWLVGLYFGSEDAALYGAAVKVAVLIGMPLNLINAVLPPYIVQLHTAGRYGELERMLRGSATLACIPAALLALLTAFFGGDLMAHLFGEQFRQAALTLTILCIGHLMHVAFGSGGLILMMTGRGKALLRITFFSTVMLLFGCIVARPFGISGIALAAACALILQKIIMWLWIKSELGIRIHAGLNKETFNEFQSIFGKNNNGS